MPSPDYKNLFIEALEKNVDNFWNSKAVNVADVRGATYDLKHLGKKEFARFPFPPTVKKQLLIWAPRQEPNIIDL